MDISTFIRRGGVRGVAVVTSVIVIAVDILTSFP